MKPEKNLWFYLKLFATTFQLSAFTYGGGYVIVPLMKKQFVEKMGWIEEQDMLDFTAIAQSAPGPIAVNTSVLMGYHLAGVPGALISMAGTILPPLILLTIISYCYAAFADNQIIQNVLRGMQAGVCAVIVDVVFGMGLRVAKQKQVLPMLLMVGAFVAVAVLDIHVMLVIVSCGLIGLLVTIRQGRRQGKDGGQA